jgi:hypothetical protein
MISLVRLTGAVEMALWSLLGARGARTREAQENVALQIAEQISDFLLDGAMRRHARRESRAPCLDAALPARARR